MEPFLAVGIATTAVTFLDFGFKIIKRLEELQKAGDLPKELREVRTRLPLITEIVFATHKSYQTLSAESQERLDGMVQKCFDLVQKIESILDSIMVADGDSRLRRFSKAVMSLPKSKQVASITTELRENVQLLVALNVSHSEKKAELTKAKQVVEELPTYPTAVGIFLLPFKRDHKFIGRNSVLENIEKLLAEHPRVSVAGMGGVGKSQVAIEMAYRYKDHNQNAHIFWVYGGTIPRFYEGYKRIAQELNLDKWDDPDVSILDLVSTWFRQTKDRFLLVLDNADNINYYWPGRYNSPGTIDARDNLSLYLPEPHRTNGKLLITSRDSRVAEKLSGILQPVVLNPMTQMEAKELFSSRAGHAFPGDDGEALNTLVCLLGFVPLAITQAALFIVKSCISIEEYIVAVTDDKAGVIFDEEFFESSRDEESANAIFRTWKISYDDVSELNPKAADLLCFFSVLDGESIPKWLGPRSLMTIPEVWTCIDLLNSFHLISLDSGSSFIQIHRMVQRFVQCTLKRAGTLEKWQETALSCVSKVYPTMICESEYPKCDALTPHVQILTGYDYKSKQALIDLGVLLCWSADYDVDRGMWAQAMQRARRSYEILKEQLPSDDQRLASAIWSYGRISYYEAKSETDIEHAASLLRRGYCIADDASWIYAELAFELAHLYYVQNKENECLEMGKECFECYKRVEGKMNVRTLDVMHDYSLTLAMFGHETEAITKWRIVLDFCPKSDASEDTKNIYIWRSLAGIAEFQGDAGVAEILYGKLVALSSAIYNPDHVHVFDYRLSQAEQILRQGRPGDAIDLSRKKLESCQNKSEWGIMLSCYEMMAEGYKAQSEFGLELENRFKCLELQTNYLGEDHKESISAADAAAKCLLANGTPEKAESLLGRVLKWRELSLGKRHQDTVDTIELLGICKSQQNLDEDAEAMFTLAVERNRKDKQRLSLSLDNLCSSLWNQQKWDMLETRCKEALSMESTYSTSAHWMLISALEKQNKIEEALSLRLPDLELEGQTSDPAESRRQVRSPSLSGAIERRFGRIIHPRTWSS